MYEYTRTEIGAVSLTAPNQLKTLKRPNLPLFYDVIKPAESAPTIADYTLTTYKSREEPKLISIK